MNPKKLLFQNLKFPISKHINTHLNPPNYFHLFKPKETLCFFAYQQTTTNNKSPRDVKAWQRFVVSLEREGPEKEASSAICFFLHRFKCFSC